MKARFCAATLFCLFSAAIPSSQPIPLYGDHLGVC